MAQIGLLTLHSLVGAVPVAGTAIGGLLSVLQFVNVSMNHVWVTWIVSPVGFISFSATRPTHRLRRGLWNSLEGTY
jgi:phosphate/sulfate permease